MSTSNSQMASATFAVEGMGCADCVTLITNYLSAQPGVVKAVGNFEARSISVTYRPERTLPDTIARAIVASDHATDWKHNFQPTLLAETGS